VARLLRFLQHTKNTAKGLLGGSTPQLRDMRTGLRTCYLSFWQQQCRPKVIYIHSHRMAPNLADSQHAEIRHMIHSKSLKADKMAAVAGCSRRSICAINRNLRCFGSTKAPSNGGRRPRSIIPLMLDALCKYLEKDPGKYLYEMVNFLQTKFEVSVTTSSVRRALDSIP
jgi:transposase